MVELQLYLGLVVSSRPWITSREQLMTARYNVNIVHTTEKDNVSVTVVPETFSHIYIYIYIYIYCIYIFICL